MDKIFDRANRGAASAPRATNIRGCAVRLYLFVMARASALASALLSSGMRMP
jgi:hypothetical protein